MKAPYRARIMTVINGLAFELKRFHRPVAPSDEHFWTEGREDRSWTEYALTDTQTITPRWRPPAGTKTNKMKLQPEELAGLTQ